MPAQSVSVQATLQGNAIAAVAHERTAHQSSQSGLRSQSDTLLFCSFCFDLCYYTRTFALAGNLRYYSSVHRSAFSVTVHAYTIRHACCCRVRRSIKISDTQRPRSTTASAAVYISFCFVDALSTFVSGRSPHHCLPLPSDHSTLALCSRPMASCRYIYCLLLLDMACHAISCTSSTDCFTP